MLVANREQLAVAALAALVLQLFHKGRDFRSKAISNRLGVNSNQLMGKAHNGNLLQILTYYFNRMVNRQNVFGIICDG